MACPSEGQDYRFESCWVRHFLLCMGADKMRFVFCALVVAFLLGGCNSVQIKPNTLDVNEIFYIDRGGDQIQHAIKSVMEKRNYNFTVGQKRATIKSTYITSGKNEPNAPIATTDKARYIVQIDEGVTKFRPIWCAFNGFWWWKFNISIADNESGQELLGWVGHGCANSSVRLLERLLDDLEIKE